MIKVGIIGVTGYTGIELLRLLQQHKDVKVTETFTQSYIGENISNIFPHLEGHVNLEGKKLDLEVVGKNCDVIFISLPHGHAIDIVQSPFIKGKKIIDLGADFRLKSPESYELWYQHKAAPQKLLEQAVYGLPELCDRKKISSASLIANPGCYATASLLAVWPALKAGIVNNDCIFDAKSGVSGAGRAPSLANHYCEISENLVPYKVAGLHRHTPEIEQEISSLVKSPIKIQFTPHLIPISRGLLVTTYLKLKKSLLKEDILEIYQAAYKDEQFIRVQSGESIPNIKHVRGTNYCNIGIYVDKRTERLIVISVIDNLIKGAAGQAIQNMNIMYQLPEGTGLRENLAIYP